MTTNKTYSPDVRESAVKLVLEADQPKPLLKRQESWASTKILFTLGLKNIVAQRRMAVVIPMSIYMKN
jgi:hypothetical protein